MATETTTLRIKRDLNSRGFQAAVKEAKWMRGKFDAASKTWTVSTAEWANYEQGHRFISFEVIGATGCAAYSAAEGCPLHGETCAPEYR